MLKTSKNRLAALAVFLSAFFFTPAASPAQLTQAESNLLNLVNRFRAAHSLAPLRIDPKLERAAKAHSIDMIRHGYFAHGAYASRIRSFGVKGRTVGENLAWGVGRRGEAQSILRMWLRSPSHRANLLRPGFRRIGLGMPVGRFAGYRYARVVTADFAGS